MVTHMERTHGVAKLASPWSPPPGGPAPPPCSAPRLRPSSPPPPSPPRARPGAPLPLAPRGRRHARPRHAPVGMRRERFAEAGRLAREGGAAQCTHASASASILRFSIACCTAASAFALISACAISAAEAAAAASATCFCATALRFAAACSVRAIAGHGMRRRSQVADCGRERRLGRELRQASEEVVDRAFRLLHHLVLLLRAGHRGCVGADLGSREVVVR